ncbi:unnamed protein product [Calypogeia fissa]
MDPRVSPLVALAFAVFACTNAQFGSDIHTECGTVDFVEESDMKAIYKYCITDKQCPEAWMVAPKSTHDVHTAGGAHLLLKNNRPSVAKIVRDADVGPSITKIMECGSPTPEQLAAQGQTDGRVHIFVGKVIGSLGEHGIFGVAKDAQIIIQKVQTQSGQQVSDSGSKPSPSPVKPAKGRSARRN